ncbi:MAG: hypothetical protein HY901_04810 [Deltaproteobacteria bacterium]|nr:hypothetical protein [Deltaproteobacteria bacterium]
MPFLRLALIAAVVTLSSLAARAEPRTVAQAAELQAQAVSPGSARVGDVFQGQGRRGDDADWNVELQPGCYLVSGAGGPGVERLYLSLFSGKERLAKVASKTALATLAHCVQAAGTYRVRATIDEGKGAFAMAVFSQPTAPAAPDLERMADAYAAAQFPQLTRAVDRLPLVRGSRDQEWLVPVREGVCTTFVGVADAAAKDLSLKVLHPNGKEQARTKDAAPVAVLQHCAKQTGTWSLKARLGGAGGAGLARFESQPAMGLEGVALGAALLGRAYGATTDPVQVLAVRAEDGDESDWRLPLEAGCYLISVLRGAGVAKVNVSVTDSNRQKVKATDLKPAALCAAAPAVYKVRAVIGDGEGDLAVAVQRVESATVAEARPELLCDAHAAALAPAGSRAAEAWAVPAGKRPEWLVSLRPGICYSFVGAGVAIKELHLDLRSATNKEQAKGREDRERTLLDFCPREPGSYKLVVQVEGKGSAAVVRYERAAPVPQVQAAAQPESERGPQPTGWTPPNVNVTVNGAALGMPAMPGLPGVTVSTGAEPAAGQHQVGSGAAEGGSTGTCCVNGRFHECSPKGMKSCSEVASCMSDVARDAMNSKSGSLSGFADRADACARKLDTFACTAQPSRNGECK